MLFRDKFFISKLWSEEWSLGKFFEDDDITWECNCLNEENDDKIKGRIPYYDSYHSVVQWISNIMDRTEMKSSKYTFL